MPKMTNDEFRAKLGDHTRELAALLGIPVEDADHMMSLKISVNGLEIEYNTTEGDHTLTHIVRRRGPVIFRPLASAAEAPLLYVATDEHCAEHVWEPFALPDGRQIQKCKNCPVRKYINPETERKAAEHLRREVSSDWKARENLPGWVAKSIEDAEAAGRPLDEGA